MFRKILIALFFMSSVANAATYNAATCSLADVQTAYNLTSSGDTVSIPAGECTWTGTLTLGRSVIISGAGSTLTKITRDGTAINIGSTASRITGIGFYPTGTSTTVGIVSINGGKGWRVDNCRFNGNGVNSYGIMAQGPTYETLPSGLVDNNYFYRMRVMNKGLVVSLNNQHRAWYYPAPLGEGGASNAIYIEDNTWWRDTNAYSQAVDSNQAGRYVFRYNNLTNTYIEAHAVQSNTNRGTRTWEVYGNTFTDTTTAYLRPVFLRAGTGVLFNNTMIGTFSVQGLVLDSRRQYDPAPHYCDGTRVGFDGNENAYGYLCRDQPGAGPDSELSTSIFSGSTWVSTDWKPQTKLPVYAWSNTFPVTDNLGSEVHIVENRDYYDSYGTTFNGTVGVGVGTYAERPATCTTGVGYWATDRGGNWNTINADSANDGAFYKCTSTNTWTLYYTPYVYPHPLRYGSLPPDVTPPVTTNTTPATIACDAVSPVNVNLTVTTNETANCAYCDDSVTGCDAASGYSTILSAGSAYSTTGGTSHMATIADLPCSASYTYRSACRDTSPSQNANTTSTTSAFTIGAAAGGDTSPPVMSNPLPNGTTFSCTSNPVSITLSVHAEDETSPVTCKYNTTDVAYASMSGTFDTTGGVPVKTVDDSYPESNYATTISLYTGQSTAIGQSFQSNGGTLNSVAFFLRKTGSPTGNAVAKVYAHTGTFGTSSLPTGAALATSDTLDVSTLGAVNLALTEIAFSGANRIPFTDTTYYVATLEWSGGDASNNVVVGRDDTPSHAGNAVGYISSAWNAYPTRDTVFYVYTMVSSGSDFSKSVSLACGQNLNYYYRCSDGTNANTTSSTASFSIASPTPPSVYQFEDCSLAAPMLEVSDVGASGGSYISTTTQLAGTATCTVSAPSSGTYRIIARTMAGDTGSDSALLTVGSNSQITWVFNPGPIDSNWNVWRESYVNALGIGTIAIPQYNPYQVSLSSGDNTFVWAGREVGAKLDYFYIEKINEIPPPQISGGSQIIGSGHTVVVGSGGSGTKVVIP